MVEPDLNYKSGGKPSASRTVNKYGNRWWQVPFFIDFSLNKSDNLLMKVLPDPIFFPKVRWE